MGEEREGGNVRREGGEVEREGGSGRREGGRREGGDGGDQRREVSKPTFTAVVSREP
jgi:hypothetical protein